MLIFFFTGVKPPFNLFPKKFSIFAGLSAYIEHRWEDAAVLLPFLLMHTDVMPVELLYRVSFCNMLILRST